jgi:protein involved in polysaccharide export with SLBB domain
MNKFLFSSRGLREDCFLRASVLLFLPLLYACGPKITVPELTSAEVPHMEEIGNYPHTTYHVEPGDTIQIVYPYHPEMKQEVTVRPDGRISAIVAGDVDVAGKTTKEVEKLLEDGTSHRLRDPEVEVNVTQYAPKGVYVYGEVGKPGIIPYRKSLTPLQAITASGGFLDTAQVESVVLVRSGGENEVVTRTLNLLVPVTEGTKEPLFLAPHDIVYVPKTGIANANVWVKQHIQDLLPVPASYRIVP